MAQREAEMLQEIDRYPSLQADLPVPFSSHETKIDPFRTTELPSNEFLQGLLRGMHGHVRVVSIQKLG